MSSWIPALVQSFGGKRESSNSSSMEDHSNHTRKPSHNSQSDINMIDKPVGTAGQLPLPEGREGRNTSAVSPATRPSQELTRRHSLKAEVRQLQKQVDALTQEKRKLGREAKATQDLETQLYNAEAQRRGEAEAYQQQLRSMTEALHAWKSRADDAADQLQIVQSSQKDTEDLLNLRTTELTHAQTFLSKADNASHAQILSMVENLNALGFQLAALLVDDTTFPPERSRPAAETVAGVKNLLGSAMTRGLVSEKHAEDPTILQTALQTTLCDFVSYLLTQWDTGLFQDAQNQLLTHIYKKLFEIEPQAVSARWRALVRRCIRHLNRDAGMDASLPISEQLYGSLRDVIAVAGGVQSGGQSEQDMLKKVKEIVDLCFSIQRVTNEDVASADFEVLYFSRRTPFAPATMEDVDDDGRGSKRSLEGVRIMCTSDLGLQRREKIDGSGEANGTVKITVMLKAKVQLLSSS